MAKKKAVAKTPTKSRTLQDSNDLLSIALERPASVRRHLPEFDKDWLLPNYFVGPENDGLKFLFSESTLNCLQDSSPVLLCGETHVGKTMIAVALASKWSKLTKKRPICFTTGEEYAQQYAEAVEIDDIDGFRKRHRSCQMLVLDGLHDMSGKAAAQDELSANLDVLAAEDCPVIITNDQLPSTTKAFRAGLVSRLVGGYSLTLQRPSLETAQLIMTSLCNTKEFKLTPEPLFPVLEQCMSLRPSAIDIRDLLKLARQCCDDQSEVDLQAFSQLSLQHLGGEAPSISLIAKTVARRMRVKLTDMRGSTRQANIVRARGLAIHLARLMTHSSLQQIGEFFGGRDHSTVLHAWRKTEQLLDKDTELANLLRDIRAELLNNC